MIGNEQNWYLNWIRIECTAIAVSRLAHHSSRLQSDLDMYNTNFVTTRIGITLICSLDLPALLNRLITLFNQFIVFTISSVYYWNVVFICIL